MPSIKRSFNAKATQGEVCSFFSNLRNLAICFPGLEEFKELGGNLSYWRVKIDLPMTTRTVELQASLDKFTSSEANFTLKGLNENVDGSGNASFKEKRDLTEVNFELSIEAGSVMAPFLNQLIAMAMPRLADRMIDNIVTALERQEGGS